MYEGGSTPPLCQGDMIRFMSKMDANGQERTSCMGASEPAPLGDYEYGGILNSNSGLNLRVPVGEYCLCAAWVGGYQVQKALNFANCTERLAHQLDASSGSRRRLQWDGAVGRANDGDFSFFPDVTMFADEWTAPIDDFGEQLTGGFIDRVPWWVWLLLMLALLCCLCCCWLYCCLYRKTKKYRPQGKTQNTTLRRNGFQKSLANVERLKLGMSIIEVMKDASGVGSFKLVKDEEQITIEEDDYDELGVPRRIISTDSIGNSVIIDEGSPIYEAIKKRVSVRASMAGVNLADVQAMLELGVKREILETVDETVTIEEPPKPPRMGRAGDEISTTSLYRRASWQDTDEEAPEPRIPAVKVFKESFDDDLSTPIDSQREWLAKEVASTEKVEAPQTPEPPSAPSDETGEARFERSVQRSIHRVREAFAGFESESPSLSNSGKHRI